MPFICQPEAFVLTVKYMYFEQFRTVSYKYTLYNEFLANELEARFLGYYDNYARC